MNNFIKKSKKFFEIIAGSFYLKVGRGPHIHSCKFDNEEIQKIFQQCETVISIHGEKNTEESFVIIGGLDAYLVKKIEDSFFKNGFTQKRYFNRLGGLHKQNVCNRGLLKKGIQLEISRKLREDLLEDKSKLSLFIESIIIVL